MSWSNLCQRRFVSSFAVPTVLVFALSKYTGFEQPLLNFDVFLTAAALSINAPRRVSIFAACAYVLMLAIQAFQFLEYLYGLSLWDIPVHIFAIASWPMTAYVSVLCIVAIMALASKLNWHAARREVSVFPVALLAALFLTFDVAFSPNFIYSKDFVDLPNIVGSPTLGEFRRLQLSSGGFELWDRPPNSYLKIKALIDSHKLDDSRLLIISFESLGDPADPAARAMLHEYLKTELYEFELDSQFSEKANGGTLNGELRLLCGIKNIGSYLNVNGRPRDFSACIPNYAKKLGLFTVAAHSNSSLFYNRREIYPVVGFNDFVSAEVINADRVDFACSNLFGTACDGQVVSLALARKLGGSPPSAKIVYVMTIDTHLPLRAKDAVLLKRGDEAPVNVYYSAVKQTISGIAEAIRNSDSPPDYLVIQGDHPPPFVDVDLRSAFLQGAVPVFVFRRRTMEQ